LIAPDTYRSILADYRNVLAKKFASNGLLPKSAEAMASLVTELGDGLLLELLAYKIEPLRTLTWFEAWHRELVGDGNETVEAAAKRLHVNPRVIRECRQRIREAYGTPSAPLIDLPKNKHDDTNRGTNRSNCAEAHDAGCGAGSADDLR